MAKNGGCLTMLDIIETNPELSRLSKAITDLPLVRKALADADRTDTFFAPTDAAIQSFLEWGGQGKAKAGSRGPPLPVVFEACLIIEPPKCVSCPLRRITDCA
jgi:hypothetical protein